MPNPSFRKPYWRMLRTLTTSRNLWIALALLAANALAWIGASPVETLPQVEPRLAPEIAEIRENIWSGKAAGETFSIVFTEQMAAEAVAWYLERHPNVPFSHPRVEIDPGGVTGAGLARLFGLRTPVHGRVQLGLEQGELSLRILELGIARARAPGFIVDALQDELARQVDLAQALPVTLTRLEFGDGIITVEGIYDTR